MDAPVNVPVDDPNADTEWNDILRKHGVIPEKPPSPTPMIQEALVEARKRAHENRLEGKTLDELDDLEDEEDEQFLQKYRAKRMEELSTLAKQSVFGQVFPLQKPDYQRDVTDASEKAFVLVHLASPRASSVESKLLTHLWRDLAAKYGEVKFCEIQADLCIEGYPEKNTPTILVYKNGDIIRQIVTLRELAGQGTQLRGECLQGRRVRNVERLIRSDLEKLLVATGAVAEGDHRVQATANEHRTSHHDNIEDDEDEWD